MNTIHKHLMITVCEKAIEYVFDQADIPSLTEIETRLAHLRATFDATPDEVTDAEIEAMAVLLENARFPSLSRIWWAFPFWYPPSSTATSQLDQLTDLLTWSNIDGKPATFPPDAHIHDDRYYTKTEVETQIAAGSGAELEPRVEANETALANLLNQVTGIQAQITKFTPLFWVGQSNRTTVDIHIGFQPDCFIILKAGSVNINVLDMWIQETGKLYFVWMSNPAGSAFVADTERLILLEDGIRGINTEWLDHAGCAYFGFFMKRT